MSEAGDSPCTCPQCKVRRALFGDAVPTLEQRSDAIWALAFVLGAQLAHFTTNDMRQVLGRISKERVEQIERWAKRDAARRAAEGDIASMEVAGHG